MKDGPGVPFPPPLVYIAGLLAGLGAHWAIDPGEPPALVRIVCAVACVGAALYFLSASLRRFRLAGTDPIPWRPDQALVTDGPYRLTRNPMYVGMALLFAGIAFGFGALIALAILPLVILVIDRVVIAREEPYLERLFGEEYASYKQRVRRWL
ncbi:MAG: isoprenylcysteine carboxylmethyltransferase family protein [Actinomycetota bacterium]|nr:isoprenylcysteine carboxylmethyltransferase family protein [Actinomycetota bacterium]